MRKIIFFKIPALFFIWSIYLGTGQNIILAQNAQDKQNIGKNYFTPPRKEQLKTLLANNPHESGYILFQVKPEFARFCQSNSIDIEPLREMILNIGGLTYSWRYQLPIDQYTLQNPLTRIYRLNLKNGADIADIVSTTQASKYIQYAFPEFYDQQLYTPNDPSLATQWWVGKMQADKAWDITKGDEKVVIGIVDTGFDLDHPDIKNNALKNLADPVNGVDDDGNGYIDDFDGWDFVGADISNPTQDNDPRAKDGGNDHGALMSGCACAESDNSIGSTGPALKVKFIPVKVASDNSSTLISGFDGILYAAQRGCKIINCSWGSKVFSPIRQQVIDYVYDFYKSAIFAAAGNSNMDELYYPASYNRVLSIVGSDQDDKKGTACTYNYSVGVMAPAADVLCAAKGGGYQSFTEGYTSVATAIASGVAALTAAKFPDYSGDQIRERIRVTADDVYSANPTYKDKLGSGRLNMFQALTKNTPSIRMTNFAINDGNNGALEINETAFIRSNFKNYLDPTSDLKITLVCDDAFVSILQANHELSFLNTGEEALVDQSFQIKLNNDCPYDHKVWFKWIFEVPGQSYKDFQYFSIIVRPTYLDVNVNRVASSINSRGNWGYNDYPANSQGIGFTLDANPSWLYEGGFLVANNGKVSDNIRNFGGQDTDFETVEFISIQKPGDKADAQLKTVYKDNNPEKLGVEITQNTYAYTNIPDDQYFIQEYVIKNTTSTDMTNVYAGLFADWDVDGYTDNLAGYESQDKYVFVKKGNFSTGIRSLTNESVIVSNLNADLPVPFNTENKFKYLTETQQPLEVGPSDVYQFISCGPFDIKAGETHTVAFAIMGSKTDVSELKVIAEKAQKKYDEITNSTSCNLNFSYRTEPAGNCSTKIIFENMSGSTGGYLYTIDGGGNWSNMSEFTVSEGNYSIGIRNASDATCNSEKITVAVKNEIIYLNIAFHKNTSCTSCNDGVIILEGNKAFPGTFKYSIDGGAVYSDFQDFRKLSKGIYSCRVININGCTSEPVTIEIQ